MGSRHRDRSRDRGGGGGGGGGGRDREKDRDRDRRERRRSRDRHRDRSRRDRSRDRSKEKIREESRGRSKAKSKEKSIEPDGQKLLAETLATIAASRNYASLVAAKEQEELEANMTPEEREREERRRRRKTRWGGSEHDKTFIPGMPTILPSSLNKEQEQAYLIQLQIEDVSRKLRSGDLGIPANIEERSPSPEPIYSSDGKRLNTREFRTRRRLEEERHALVLRMLSINPEYKPPMDYKPPVIRVHDKVMIPQEEHPEINFVGLLIGPRGNTLKTMEKETGAKIIIRGKGSVKEGKVGRKDGQPLPGEDEPLHAYITATNPEHVKKAVERIKEVIRQGVEVPESQNDLRRMQLRELAQLNGTLRENEGMRCNNCGASDHKSWLCPDKPNVTNNIVCSSCGGAGHIARDCRQKRPGLGGPPQVGDKAKIDEEYLSLMAELGEGPQPDFMQNGAVRRNGTTPGAGAAPYNIFDRAPMAPRAIMPGPRPDLTAQMIPNTLPPAPWTAAAQPQPPGITTWQPTNCPPGLLPPPPPPGASSPPNVPPIVPWMAANNQPPPPGASATPTTLPPPPPGTRMPVTPAPPPPWQGPPGTMAPPPRGPPYQWPPQNQCMPPPPPGIDMNTLLAAPPPPPPT